MDQGFTQKLCEFCPRQGSVVIQTHACITLTICVWSSAQRRHLESGEAGRQTAHKHLVGKYKAFHVCGLLSADHKSWEWLRLKFNCTPGKRMMLVHHECDFTYAAYSTMFLHSDSRVLRESSELLPWSSMMLTIFAGVCIWNQAAEKLLAPTLWENTKPCMHAFFVWEWLRRISGKRWCWSSMRSTALPNMRKAATTLPDSDTGFVDRALGLIWPNSVRLQDVILTTEMCHTTWNARKRTY